MKQNTKSSSADKINVQAKTLEQALIKACGLLGVSQEGLAYKVLKEDTSKGFMSFFKSSSIEIEAWSTNSRNNGSQRSSASRSSTPRSPRSHAPTQERTPRYSNDEDEVPAEPLSVEKTLELVEELRSFCEGICALVTGETVAVTANNTDGRLILNIEDEYIAGQISKNSKLAEAMEHILRKKPRHLRQELPFRIFVDVSGVRRKREEELINMAQDLSSKVHENKRPIVLNYKSSYDRKIIHMALDKDDRVYTKSIGSGPNRKLMILPVKDALPGSIEIDA